MNLNFNFSYSGGTCETCGESKTEGIIHFCPTCSDCGEVKKDYFHSCPTCDECGEIMKRLYHICPRCSDCNEIKRSNHLCPSKFYIPKITLEEKEKDEITVPTLKMYTIEESRKELSSYNGYVNSGSEMNLALNGYLSKNLLSDPVKDMLEKNDLSSRPSYWYSGGGYIPKKATSYYS